MRQRINLVESIKHVKNTAITSFVLNNAGKVKTTWSSARDIPFVMGTASYVEDPEQGPAGKVWKVSITGLVKSQVKEFELGVLLVQLESGETIVIGSQDHPVRIFLAESLQQKRFEIKHSSPYKPPVLAL